MPTINIGDIRIPIHKECGVAKIHAIMVWPDRDSDNKRTQFLAAYLADLLGKYDRAIEVAGNDRGELLNQRQDLFNVFRACGGFATVAEAIPLSEQKKYVTGKLASIITASSLIGIFERMHTHHNDELKENGGASINKSIEAVSLENKATNDRYSERIFPESTGKIKEIRSEFGDSLHICAAYCSTIKRLGLNPLDQEAGKKMHDGLIVNLDYFLAIADLGYAFMLDRGMIKESTWEIKYFPKVEAIITSRPLPSYMVADAKSYEAPKTKAR